MRKWMVLVLAAVLALGVCSPAWAVSVTDALGITGGGESSVRGDLSARTATDLYVVTNDARASCFCESRARAAPA